MRRALILLLCLACNERSTPPLRVSSSNTSCDEGNGGITLPAGFCASVFADNAGGARHLVVAPNGDVLITLLSAGSAGSGGVLVLRDTNHDGRADLRATFGPLGGTGIAIRGSYLYVDAQSGILRYALPTGGAPPLSQYNVVPETMVSGLPTGGHGARNIAFDAAGGMYVNVGSSTNSCQVNDRAAQSPGVDPCTELSSRAGIWRFDANTKGQTLAQGARYATGIRNAMGLALNGADGKLYATQHGRDQLHDNWPALFTAQQSADNPAEELVQVNQGDDFGWPYCFYSNIQNKVVLAPEYGGDGQQTGRCVDKKAPVVAFPGHWAPEALLFYSGTMFPAKYRNGAFVSFHGSWNRSPLPQDGFRVAFVAASPGGLGSTYEIFADGFAGASTNSAIYRPMGLAQGPDGALYITDDTKGRVWRVVYGGP